MENENMTLVRPVRVDLIYRRKRKSYLNIPTCRDIALALKQSPQLGYVVSDGFAIYNGRRVNECFVDQDEEVTHGS